LNLKLIWEWDVPSFSISCIKFRNKDDSLLLIVSLLKFEDRNVCKNWMNILNC
jgi:hypothetical protein